MAIRQAKMHGAIQGEKEEAALGEPGARAVHLADVALTPDIGQEDQVGDHVADQNRAKGHADGEGAKAPLFENKAERLGEDENERGKTEHDRLTQEHLKGPAPDSQYVLGVQPGRLELVRAVDLVAGPAATSRLAVDKDRGACFRDEEEMQSLGDSAEDQLHPEHPVPG
ncbi:hypothetical protein IFM46972_07935 [Aspergillus udagawae]|uniref:Uncharacterized protein n=1 Tax=Aspergillus udagawae TaxID=91492 RepID=A0A8H3P936_9EURO|nr:hypothetical protein IFM46972_07935 [Aspergillus udagawae]